MRALHAMGIHEPTPIQKQALTPLLSGKDVIGQARTGSGKTLAFGIPLIESVDTKVLKIQALVLTPTRELAIQVGEVLAGLGTNCGIRTTLVIGGRSQHSQEMAIRQGVHVVVGAPGRVLALIKAGTLATADIRYLVLDEADEMLDQGFAPDVERILATLPKRRQTALFSATVPQWVHKMAAKHMYKPEVVAVDTRPEDQPTIAHDACLVPADSRFDVLCGLLDTRGPGSVIVFGRTKHGVKKLGRQLEGLGYPVATLQGNLSQNARERVMAAFRDGSAQILLATNVAARGIDVSAVDLVINYQLPESAELLTHRVGRTGRMGREGRALTLLAPEDTDRFRQFERQLGRPVGRISLKELLPGRVIRPDSTSQPAAAPAPAASRPPMRRSVRPQSRSTSRR